MVTIHCSYTVIPSESTPTSNISLSHCDQLKLPNHGSQLYVYTNSPKSDTNSSPSSSFKSSVDTLRTSLSKALNYYYPLAGRLCWIQGGRLELLCNSKGVTLLEATCHESSLDGFGDFVLPPHVVEQLVPKVDYGSVHIEDMPLMVAQVTRFSCGGITLGVIVCRAMVDGASLGNFMSSWSKLARGESLDSSLVPLLDRTMLDSLGMHVAPRFEHAEFLPPPLWGGRLEQVQQTQMRDLATATMKLTKGQVEKLKKKANGFGNGSKVSNFAVAPRRPYTSFEVIGGHLWRCFCKVRCEGNGGQPTRLTALVNCRNRLRPPLPHAFFGNATFPTVTPTCSFDNIVHKPLNYAVGNVRGAIERMSDEYVRSAIDYTANQKDMNLLRDKLYNPGGRQFKVNPNLNLVSWTNFPFYATDFGWGKPDYMVSGSINSDGKAFLMNNGSGDGFIVAICLQPSEIDALKKLFYEDIEEDSIQGLSNLSKYLVSIENSYMPTAGAITEALGRLRDEYVRGALDYVSEHKDVSLADEQSTPLQHIDEE